MLYIHIHIYIHICTHTHIHIIILLNAKQNKILLFTTWMVLKTIMFSEIRQKKTNIKTMCYQFYMELKK